MGGQNKKDLSRRAARGGIGKTKKRLSKGEKSTHPGHKNGGKKNPGEATSQKRTKGRRQPNPTPSCDVEEKKETEKKLKNKGEGD